MPARVQPVGGGDGENGDIVAVFGEEARRLDRFRRDDALIGDADFAIRSRRAQPVCAVDDVLLQRIVQHALGLLQRHGGEAQIDRSAGFVAQPAGGFLVLAVALHIIERPAHDLGEFVHEGGFETCQSILRHADQRRADALMRAAFRRQGDAARCRH